MSKNLETKIGKVRAFLEEGNTITSWQAIQMFAYTRLSDGIYRLINDYGMPIESKMVYEGDGVKYAKYYLTIEDSLKNEIRDFMLRGNKITAESCKEIFGVENFAVLLNDLREEGINVRSEVHKPLCGKSVTRYFIL